MEDRLNNLDDRVGRMEQQMTSLAVSMQRVADSMTQLARMDERVARLLVDNRTVGERVGAQNEAIHALQLEVSGLKLTVDNLQSTNRTWLQVAGKVTAYVFGIVAAALLAKFGIEVG